MKTGHIESISCPNCNKSLAHVPVGQTAGKVRKTLTEALIAHLPKCKHRGAALVEFARMFGTAGKLATKATLFKMLHDDEIARNI